MLRNYAKGTELLQMLGPVGFRVGVDAGFTNLFGLPPVQGGGLPLDSGFKVSGGSGGRSLCGLAGLQLVTCN